MKVKRIVAFVLAAVMMCAIATSCEIGHSDSIVGKWKEMDAQIGYFDFKSDGTLTIEGLGYKIDADYELNGDKIKISYNSAVYTDPSGESETIEPFGYYKEFNKRKNKPSGSVTTVKEDFEGTYKISAQANSADKLEIFLYDDNGTEQLKWLYYRTYES